MITKTKIKELEKDFEGTVLNVLVSYGKGDFDKNGIDNNSRLLADKLGGSWKTYKNRFTELRKFGTFEKYFPESKAKKYIQVSFRMSEDLHRDLKAKSYKLNKSLNKLITQAVKRSLR